MYLENRTKKNVRQKQFFLLTAFILSPGFTTNTWPQKHATDKNIPSSHKISKLHFSIQPSNRMAGENFSLEIIGLDKRGRLAGDPSAQVKLLLNGGLEHAALKGRTTAGISTGIARFEDLNIEAAHNNYSLTAIVEDRAFTVSHRFDITPAAASKLAIPIQPMFGTPKERLNPSIAYDPHEGRLWMVYSAINIFPNNLPGLNTRLAFSDNAGESWHDTGIVINHATELHNPPIYYDSMPTAWWHEVPSLTFNPLAPAHARWSLVWHRYVYAKDQDPATDDRRFAFGWIAYKSAATPGGLAFAPERKLFAGSAYDYHPYIRQYNDTVVGGTPIRANTLHEDLRECVSFSEPGMLATNEGTYISISCFKSEDAADPTLPLVMLKHDYLQNNWQYSGTLLDSIDSEHFTGVESHFSGADLVKGGSGYYLIASPVISDKYAGCLGFQIQNMSTATLTDVDNDGHADIKFAAAGTQNGKS